MNDLFERQKAKERADEALRYAREPKQHPRKRYKFSSNETDILVKLLLPQCFEHATSAIHTALYQIDPSWQKGQFDFFNDHFRMQILRSFFVPRFSFNDNVMLAMGEEQLLEKILHATQNFEDNKKAAFYGRLLSEYVLRRPLENLPFWAVTYGYLPNWLLTYYLHSELWKRFYW